MHFPALAVFSGIWVKPKVELSQRGEVRDGGGGGSHRCHGDGSPSQGALRGKQVTHLIRKADLKELLLRPSRLCWYHTSLSEKLRSTYFLFQ